ncbi:hypothetical protein KM043_011177 [Ampulex compressa]|nr:hypothetical protein KM043_011177 [Ampulex compressa]
MRPILWSPEIPSFRFVPPSAGVCPFDIERPARHPLRNRSPRVNLRLDTTVDTCRYRNAVENSQNAAHIVLQMLLVKNGHDLQRNMRYHTWLARPRPDFHGGG